VPYGGRPLEEVRGFALDICAFLVNQGVKMIVMACNISSAVAIDEARRRYPTLPIIGVIEPGAAAALSTGSKSIGVLATQGTVNSGAYSRVITAIDPSAIVTEVACPKFVPLVEAEQVGTLEAFEASADSLRYLQTAGSNAIILGCTHYPFMMETLTTTALDLYPRDDQPVFIDPAIETAEMTKTILAKHSLLNAQAASGSRAYFVSGEPELFMKNGSFFLGMPISNAKQISLT